MEFWTEHMLYIRTNLISIGLIVFSLILASCGGGGGSSSTDNSPTLSLPANQTISATSPSGAVVNFTVSAIDQEDGSIAATCDQVSGSMFSIGTTTVSCSATDSASNTANGSFNVTVLPFVASAGSSQAILGPLSGATINAYRLSNLASPIEGPITANQSTTDLSKAGSFDLELTGIPADEWILVTATGGQDVDADDDGVADTTPTSNTGTIHALAKASDWQTGGTINLLTELSWLELKGRIESNQTTDLEDRLLWITNNLIQVDLNNDSIIDYKDLIAFKPDPTVYTKLKVNYNTLAPNQVGGSNLADHLHAADTAGAAQWFTDAFGNELTLPTLGTSVAVTLGTALPVNDIGLTDADLTIETLAPNNEIRNESGQSTLAIAKDASGKTAMLSYVTDTQANTGAANLDINSTADALVLIFSGNGGKPNLHQDAFPIIHAHAEYNLLLAQVNDAMRSNPGFISDLKDYPEIVDRVMKIATDLNEQLTPIAAANLNPTPLNRPSASLAQKSPVALRSEPMILGAKGNTGTINDFWWGSPWDDREPWNWYGEAVGLDAFGLDSQADIFLMMVSGLGPAYLLLEGYDELLVDSTNPPFIATSKAPTPFWDTNNYAAIGNPGSMNYSMDLFDSLDNPLGWYIAPRNSTLIQKLINSGAAQRDLILGSSSGIPANTARISLDKHVWDLKFTTPQERITKFLNFLHVGIAVANLATDLSGLSKALHDVSQNMGKFDAVSTCLTELFNTADYANPSDMGWDQVVGYYFSSNYKSLFETAMGCVPDLLRAYGGAELAKLAAVQAVSTAFDTSATILSAGLKTAFDGANELTPVLSSLLYQPNKIDYYLTWNSGLIVDVTEVQFPKPIIHCSPVPGDVMSVSCNANESTPITHFFGYEWDMGDGSTYNSGTVTHTYATTGDFTIKLILTDAADASLTGSAQVTQNIGKGNSPQITSLDFTKDYNTSTGMTTINLFIDVTDPDDDITEIRWYRDYNQYLAGTAPETVTTPAEYGWKSKSIIYALEKQYRPTVIVVDSGGNETLRAIPVATGQFGQILSISTDLIPIEGGATVTVTGTNLNTLTGIDLYDGTTFVPVVIDSVSQDGTTLQFTSPQMSIPGLVSLYYAQAVSDGLTLIKMENIFFVTDGSEASLDNGMIAHYRFDGDAFDDTVNSYNGTVTGGVTWSAGVKGKAADFDGIDGKIDLGDMPNTANASYSVWFRSGSSKQYQTIFSDYISSSYTQGVLMILNGTGVGAHQQAVWFHTENDSKGIGGRSDPKAVGNYFDGLWHHAVGVIDDTTVSLYIDGKLAQTEAKSYATTTNHFFVGYSDAVAGAISDLGFQGQIDELRIYDRALTQSEIQRLYGLVSPNPVDLNDGLAAYFPLDGNAVDQTGNTADGTFYGTTTVTGVSGQAIHFDRQAFDKITVPHIPDLQPSSVESFSVNLWFKTSSVLTSTSTGDDPSLISKTERFFLNGWDIRLDLQSAAGETGTPHAIQMAVSDINQTISSVESPRAVNDGLWHMATLVMTPESLTGYIDGTMFGSTSISGWAGINNTNVMEIGNYGRDTLPNNRHFDGDIDEVRIYNRALTSSDIQQLYGLH